MYTKMQIKFSRIKHIRFLLLKRLRFIAIQSSGMLVLTFSFPNVDARAQTDIEKTLCKSDGKYVVFAHRPLKLLPFMSQPRPADGYFDKNNVQLAHEHIFFCNNGRIERNLGFGPDGRFSEESISENYRLVNDQRYATSIINNILGPDACYKSEAGTYGLRSNNCQDFAARVRAEYNRRISAMASNMQERDLIAKESSCQSSIDSVLSRVKSLGGNVSAVERGNTESKSNPFPTNQTVFFGLGSRDEILSRSRKSADIMNSPVIQSEFAKKIFSSCPPVVEVVFNLYASDWVTAFFRGLDGKVIRGKCIGPGEQPINYILKWGEYFCI